MRAAGTSLWLRPEASARQRLAGTIAHLARQLGTPLFDPHITLIGGLSQAEADIVTAASKLAMDTAPFRLRPGRIENRAEYFRCLFCEIEKNAALAGLHIRARTAFEREQDPPFFPHLSLVYADLDESTRLGLVDQLSGASCEPFDVEELQVVRTEGEPLEWRPLAAFALSRRA